MTGLHNAEIAKRLNVHDDSHVVCKFHILDSMQLDLTCLPGLPFLQDQCSLELAGP